LEAQQPFAPAENTQKREHFSEAIFILKLTVSAFPHRQQIILLAILYTLAHINVAWQSVLVELDQVQNLMSLNYKFRQFFISFDPTTRNDPQNDNNKENHQLQ